LSAGAILIGGQEAQPPDDGDERAGNDLRVPLVAVLPEHESQSSTGQDRIRADRLQDMRRATRQGRAGRTARRLDPKGVEGDEDRLGLDAGGAETDVARNPLPRVPGESQAIEVAREGAMKPPRESGGAGCPPVALRDQQLRRRSEPGQQPDGLGSGSQT